MRILPLSSVVTALSTSFFTAPTNPGDCFTLSTTHTLEDLIVCFDRFTVLAGAYTVDEYVAAQPTLDERNAWMRTVGDMLSVDNNCLSVDRTGIASDYTVRLFTESVPGGKNFCVLSESRASGGQYRRGWGLVVVPTQRSAIKRNIHFSAPHPKTDSDTPQQAAALFKLTGARSLVITGRRRDAFLGSSCQGTAHFATDSSHDIHEPFHLAMRAVRIWQNSRDRCPNSSCAYIQMHGKGDDTCPSDTVFLSAGLAVSLVDVVLWMCPFLYYQDINRPVRRLTRELDRVFSWTNSFPSISSCSKTGTDNIFGRLVNARPGAVSVAVCTVATRCEDVSGQFVHIEQDDEARRSVHYQNWANAILNAFSAIF